VDLNIKTLFACCLLSLCTVALAQQRPPNIVLILADDLGYGDLSCDGRSEWKTPNIDKLASQGTLYRRWYTASVICAPSRAALLTGRYSIHNGVTGNGSLDLPRGEITLAAELKKHGYTTALFGKWHQGAPRPPETESIHPMDRGFDEFFGFRSAIHAWQKFPKELWVGRELKPSQGYADALFADHTIDFINHNKDKPFFVYVPFIASHGQVEAPEEDISEHRSKLPLLEATYAAEVTRLDKEVARILKALDDNHLTDNTIVIFTSDHGATFEPLAKNTSIHLDSNRPFRGQKRTLWEGGIHVPGMIRWPGHIPAHAETQTLIHNLDLFPTLLAATGNAPFPELKLDGSNILPSLEGNSPPIDRTIFWEWNEGGNIQYAAMHNHLKLIITGGNKPELYDVVQDPEERIDRAAEFPEEAKKLEKDLKTWLATTTDAAKQKRSPGKKKAGHAVNDE